MASFSTGLLGFQQSADDYYRNLANDAMMQGQQAEDMRQAQQMAANEAAQRERLSQIAASIPAYDPTMLDYARRIVAAKAGYDQAAGNEAEQARQHDIAESVRALARKNGIDLSMYDAGNVNTTQATNNLSMAIDEARRNLMNSETADEFYTRRRNELMQGGLNEKRARDQAAREMQEYRAKRAHAYNNLFYDQGTTDNAINRAGAYALASMANEDPTAAATYASLFAHPVDDYKQDWARAQAYMAADIANNKAVLGNRLAMARDNNTFNNNMVMNQAQFEQALQKAGYQNQLKQENAEAQRQAQLQNVTDMVGMIQRFNPGMSTQEAFNVYMNSQSRGNQGTRNNQEKMTQAQQKSIQSIANLIDLAERDIANANMTAEEDGENLDAIEKYADEAYSKGEIDKDTYDAIMKRHYELNVARQHKHGYTS